MKKLFLNVMLLLVSVAVCSLKGTSKPIWIKAGTKETSDVYNVASDGDGYYDNYIENDEHAEINCPKTCGGKTWVDKQWKNEGTTSYCLCDVTPTWVEAGYANSGSSIYEDYFDGWEGDQDQRVGTAYEKCPAVCTNKKMYWYGTAGEENGQSWYRSFPKHNWDYENAYCNCLKPNNN